LPLFIVQFILHSHEAEVKFELLYYFIVRSLRSISTEQ